LFVLPFRSLLAHPVSPIERRWLTPLSARTAILAAAAVYLRRGRGAPVLPSTPEEALAALAGHGPGRVRTVTYRGTVALLLDAAFTLEPPNSNVPGRG
jgi:hypothetical protein